MKRHHHTSSLAMNDMLFNILLGFVLLFIIAFLLINPITKKSDVPAKAEVMIMLEWEQESPDDIDLWMQRNSDDQVGFNNKEVAPLHLDRDDLGSRNDIVTVNGKQELIKQNREIMTVRGIIPGAYYITVHAYKLRHGRSPDKPLTVSVTVFDVNPYREIYRREIQLHHDGDKVNMPGFILNSEGEITGTFDHSRSLGPDKGHHPYDDGPIRNSRQLRPNGN